MQKYAWLVNEVRENNRTSDEEGASSAIDQAIDAMPDGFVIKPFLVAHRLEVKGMLLTEYNEAEAMEKFERDGVFKTLISLVKDGILTVKEAAVRAGVTEKAFEQRMSMTCK